MLKTRTEKNPHHSKNPHIKPGQRYREYSHLDCLAGAMHHIACVGLELKVGTPDDWKWNKKSVEQVVKKWLRNHGIVNTLALANALSTAQQKKATEIVKEFTDLV